MVIISGAEGIADLDTQADNSDSQGRELASIKAQLFSVLRASTEHAICLTDGEFEILEINPVAEQLFRCKSADVIGGKFTDLANRIDLKLPSEKGITAVIKEMGRWESELATMDEAKPDGDSRTIYIAISGVQDQQGGGSGYVVVARDVTEQLERERNLVESQRMESVGLLAGGIAHDFNNILMGILGYASLAKDQIGKEQKAYRMVSIIEQSAERAASLTKQLLAYAQGGKLQSVPIHLDDMVTEMLEILGSNLHKNVVVKRDIAENLPFVLADPAQLQQVIMNLCL
ncbi:PAS domain S-box protein, partial [bacterium]|nr:PAS domain S-box protein [bacterium]